MPLPNTTPAQLSSILRRCAAASALRQGKQAHLYALVFGLMPHSTLETDLLLMYARCGRLVIARQVFDRMPHRPLHSWNILLSSYAQSSFFHYSLALIRPLLASGLRPDHFTLPSLLKASAGLGHGRTGAVLHAFAIGMALDIHLIVSGSIVDMYLKCGRLIDARKMFEQMPEKDGVVWNAMVTGFTKAGLLTEALNLFQKSQWEAVDADWMALPSVLSACSQSGDLRRGKEVHGRAVRFLLLEFDVAVGNSLIDMYSKCGLLDASCQLFSSMRVRNLLTWSVLISCYGIHGRGKEALRLYEKMRGQGLEPNSIVFTSLLSSCSHSGLINDGHAVFDSISRVYRLEPSIEHYACMVDLLGRCGSIEKALELIEKMEIEPVASIWGALLAACAVHQNVEIGEIAAMKLFELEPENLSNCVALCSIYERAGNWHGVAEMRRKMRALGVVKTPGCSWIEVNGRRLGFYQGDVSCQFSKRTLELLRGLLGMHSFNEFMMIMMIIMMMMMMMMMITAKNI
ncbi:pentatricopeptide repeat-containing protein At5g04780, mitochondrial-like [Dendrobium catenatum]|uniref:pentatricopeptide repeat-containing protein At5g04780, mitochondrial-like n=1 Tax=Dendrobium catenatum TaxID=906689 RepID=UPI0010A01969|nr:pentatricopeptide repeat-containing protein At5g04780, mitochondrial-like [Dendrobium catenatum]